MKKILVIVLVAVSGIVFGTDLGNKFDVDFNTIGETSVSVSLKKELKDKITIRVLSADRNLVIHSETIKKQTEFKKQYDFATLKHNDYIISVSNGSYVFEKTIKIDNNGITEKFGASILSEENNLVEVRLFNNIANIRNIEIINGEGKVVYETGRVRKRGYQFDLSPMPAGLYTLNVVADDTTVSKSIDKR